MKIKSKHIVWKIPSLKFNFQTDIAIDDKTMYR